MALMMTIDNDDDGADGDEQRRQGGQSSSESCVWMKDGINSQFDLNLFCFSSG